MSRFYDWDDLHPYTRESIGHAGDKCGCHMRGDQWYLCEGHDGVEEGATAVQEYLDRAIALLLSMQNALRNVGQVHNEEEMKKLTETFLRGTAEKGTVER